MEYLRLCYFVTKAELLNPLKILDLMVFSATVGIGIVYLVSILINLFGSGEQVMMIHSSGPVGIGFSLFVVGIASLNLVLDFDFIEEGAEKGNAKICGMVRGFFINGYINMALYGNP